MNRDPRYEFARLDERLVQEIINLEQQLKSEAGEAITLIAYTQAHSTSYPAASHTSATGAPHNEIGMDNSTLANAAASANADSVTDCRAGIED